MSDVPGLIYVMDMESSLSEALANRVIQMDQYMVFRKWNMDVDAVAEVAAYKDTLKGLIISGSARNVNSTKYAPPSIPTELYEIGVPVLAVCYGMQYLAHLLGQKVVRCWDEQDLKKRTKAAGKKDEGEQGPTSIHLTEEGRISPLFQGLGTDFDVWMKHTWMVKDLPEGWTLTASTDKCPIAAMQSGNIYATQFHPEPHNSLAGKMILHNFFTYICGVRTPYF